MVDFFNWEITRHTNYTDRIHRTCIDLPTCGMNMWVFMQVDMPYLHGSVMGFNMSQNCNGFHADGSEIRNNHLGCF